MVSAFERLLESDEGRRALCAEMTIGNVTEHLCRLLDDTGMKRKDLADAMGVTPGRVSQILDGQSNLTLESLARALAAFGHVLEVSSRKVEDNVRSCHWVVKPPFCDTGFARSSKAACVEQRNASWIPRNLAA